MSILSADRPSSNPNHDLFGHAPFAKSLADSICSYPGNDGLVLALYGPWGSGKSTVLNYVGHYLEQRPETEQPAVVHFNPWWFSGQENLAKAFLGQLQAVLPSKNSKFKALGELLGSFSEEIGGLADLSGYTFGLGKTLGKLASRATKRSPKDVSALKRDISKALIEAKQRVLVVVDDIDRLAPDETRQLFTVIKALADFPNVVYLLAFDREVAVQAIKQQTGMPGDQYLEKIIQVPFEIPLVDRVSLRHALGQRLDVILANTPDGMFDKSYWTNVFFEGIDPLIEVPRDIVRLTNTLTVTYPSVVGEVNPVDFVAIEALRVFCPVAYDVLRSNPDHFAGHRNGLEFGGQTDAERQAFHDSWLARLPEAQRKPVFGMLQRIFPKLENTIYGADWVARWRKAQRVCVPELFSVYFRLALPAGVVRREEVMALLAVAEQSDQLAQAFIAARAEKRADGLSKSSALLDRLIDYVDDGITEQQANTLMSVLLDIGDDLIVPGESTGWFDFGGPSRISRLVYQILKQKDAQTRYVLFADAFASGRALGTQQWLLSRLAEESEKQVSGGGREALFSPENIDELKRFWLSKVADRRGVLAGSAQLGRIIHTWWTWGNKAELLAWCRELTASDEGLLAFLPNFVTYSRSQTMGDYAIKIQPRLKPSWIEDYVNASEVAERLRKLIKNERITDERQKEAANQFLREFDMIASGKNPDSHWAFEDDDNEA